MTRGKRRWIVLSLTCLLARGGGAATSQAGPALLPDGSLLKGAQGWLTRSGDRWLLELETEIRQGPVLLEKGRTLEILPSASLEALVAAAARRPGDRYRVTGQVQTYHGGNTLFLLSYVPLAARESDPNGPKTPPVDQADEPNHATGVGSAAKGDPLAIPEQIQRRLATYRATRQRSGVTAPAQAPVPQILLDQVGLVIRDQGRAFFVTDGLGQNTLSKVFDLLPSGTLESMEHIQSQAAEPVRFRVSGLVTEYRGRSCLLLHRAVREHTYGNLGR
jgi:hypothetical protein